jgi:hypothetical protein
MRRLESGTPVTPETPLKVGDRVLVDYHGAWWEGEVLALQPNGDVKIHYSGYGSHWDETVPRCRLALDTTASATAINDDTPLSVGTMLQGQWAGIWWSAQVVAVNADKTVRIHYPGWSDSWDETVPRSRLRFAPEGDEEAVSSMASYPTSPPPAPLSFGREGTGKPVKAGTTLHAGQTVQVEWFGAWWAGEVLDVLGDGRVKIRYPGWGSGWDEAVPRSRLRLDSPGPWEELEGRPVQVRLDGGLLLAGTLIESGEDYLLLTKPDGKRILVNKDRKESCEEA